MFLIFFFLFQIVERYKDSKLEVITFNQVLLFSHHLKLLLPFLSLLPEIHDNV